MSRLLALAALLLAGLLPLPGSACQRTSPTDYGLDEYEAVFVGRVTGIHLEGYENGLLAKPDLVDPELGAITVTNGASPVNVRVAVTEPIRGTAAAAMDLDLAGCTFDLPELRERGIFFVLADKISTVVVWERDKPEYVEWLRRLGARESYR